MNNDFMFPGNIFQAGLVHRANQLAAKWHLSPLEATHDKRMLAFMSVAKYLVLRATNAVKSKESNSPYHADRKAFLDSLKTFQPIIHDSLNLAPGTIEHEQAIEAIQNLAYDISKVVEDREKAAAARDKVAAEISAAKIRNFRTGLNPVDTSDIRDLYLADSITIPAGLEPSEAEKRAETIAEIQTVLNTGSPYHIREYVSNILFPLMAETDAKYNQLRKEFTGPESAFELLHAPLRDFRDELTKLMDIAIEKEKMPIIGAGGDFPILEDDIALSPPAAAHDEAGLFKAEEDALNAQLNATTSLEDLRKQFKDIIAPRYVAITKELQARREQHRANSQYDEKQTPLFGFAHALTGIMNRNLRKIEAIHRANHMAYVPSPSPVTPIESPLEFYNKLRPQFDQLNIDIRSLREANNTTMLQEKTKQLNAIESVMLRTLRQLSPEERTFLIAKHHAAKAAKQAASHTVVTTDQAAQIALAKSVTHPTEARVPIPAQKTDAAAVQKPSAKAMASAKESAVNATVKMPWWTKATAAAGFVMAAILAAVTGGGIQMDRMQEEAAAQRAAAYASAEFNKVAQKPFYNAAPSAATIVVTTPANAAPKPIAVEKTVASTVNSTPNTIEVKPAEPIKVATVFAPKAEKPVAAAKIAKTAFRPATEPADDNSIQSEPIIEETFTIENFRPGLKSLMAACKQVGVSGPDTVCGSITAVPYYTASLDVK